MMMSTADGPQAEGSATLSAGPGDLGSQVRPSKLPLCPERRAYREKESV